MISKDHILEQVEAFAAEKLKQPDFVPGSTPLPNSGKVLTPDDFRFLVDACLDGWITSGRFTKDFERGLAKKVGVRSATFTNSGSSANLLAMSALTSRKLGKKRLQPGDEVISAGLGFPTTLNPVIQNSLQPVLVDVEAGTYNVNPDLLEESISPKTRAIFIAHTLGNPFDLTTVMRLAEEFDLWVIEDSCDALGSTFNGQLVGSFGDLSTLSFFPAHHITTGEGGAVLSNSPRLRREVESFRDWGRDCYCDTGCDNTCKKRYEWQLGTLPFGYDHKFTYSNIGYNLKATDLQAALGVAQLAKLDDFVSQRKHNFLRLHTALENTAGLELPRALDSADPAWFGFPITLSGGLRDERNGMVQFLNSRNIGTRLLFAGNVTRQPAYRNVDFRIPRGSLPESDRIMNSSFWVGVYPGLNDQQMDFIAESILTYVERVKG